MIHSNLCRMVSKTVNHHPASRGRRETHHTGIDVIRLATPPAYLPHACIHDDVLLCTPHHPQTLPPAVLSPTLVQYSLLRPLRPLFFCRILSPHEQTCFTIAALVPLSPTLKNPSKRKTARRYSFKRGKVRRLASRKASRRWMLCALSSIGEPTPNNPGNET